MLTRSPRACRAALATEPPTPDLLERKPEGRARSLITKPMYRFILSSAAYQIFWVSLIFYGAHPHMDAYHVPSKCEYLKTLPGYCCSAGAPCMWHANETAVCTLTGSGACKIEDPEPKGFCVPWANDCARHRQVSGTFEDTMHDYDKVREDALVHRTSLVFNTFIWCQLFNMMNARMINEELNVFDGVFRSNLFWIIWVMIAVVQVRACWVGIGRPFFE